MQLEMNNDTGHIKTIIYLTNINAKMQKQYLKKLSALYDSLSSTTSFSSNEIIVFDMTCELWISLLYNTTSGH